MVAHQLAEVFAVSVYTLERNIGRVDARSTHIAEVVRASRTKICLRVHLGTAYGANVQLSATERWVGFDRFAGAGDFTHRDPLFHFPVVEFGGSLPLILQLHRGASLETAECPVAIPTGEGEARIGFGTDEVG